ncbi:signal transduction histidine kinase [Kitasatospora sp. SolWspMP-SS2h]|uniref:sensor histidine kinase n=1 Tax=Kitasatospora sp. SolWspMP-SS2h TaxID=1305729 RepID=UPI000DB9BB7F|nr:HAMP domain-containing sensor histidine kinase [Kitasatospora sp. SolWspMP-SS2h]RAJ36786.1 signal transduction histidine kinase [Kitasatospora sp. SolWspMP-SS2h]
MADERAGAPAARRRASRPWRRLTGRPRIAALLTRLAPGSVRTRTTAAACAAVAAVLLVASAAVVLLLHVNLERGVEAGAREQAQVVARLAADDRLPDPIPLDHGTDFAQVTDASGRVVAASQNLAGHPALTPDGSSSAHATFDFGVFGNEHHQRVTTLTADTPTGPVTVRVGASLHTADTAEDLTTAALGVLSALLVATVGVVTWRATGRALRPVEAIRSEVAAIGDRDLDRRVPEPGGDDEVSHLAHTMNAMLDRLEAAGLRQRRFIADASHELRSPLAVLRTQLEVAHTHPDPAVRADLVAGALQDTDRLQSLATDLLLLARLDATGHDGPEEDVDLADLVRTNAESRDARPHRITLDLADGLTTTGNPMWLGRLLTNLLDNAQRHARTAVAVRLALDPATGTAIVDVANDGSVIAPADREKVFERFTRLDDARSRDDGGTGLGLSIARDIATLHGGTLTVEDTTVGATFRLRLPVRVGAQA